MPWLPSTAVRRRYVGLHNPDKPISAMTLDRWVKRGLIPSLVYIGGRKYWSSEQLEAHDQARLAVSQPSAPRMIDATNEEAA